MLEHSFRGGRPLVGGVGALDLREGARLLEGGEVDRLEDLLVELLGPLRVEGQAQQDEGVGEPLDADADGPVAQVGVARGLDRVVVDVDDLVEVAGDDAGDGAELVKVEEARRGVEGARELDAARGGGGGRRGGAVGGGRGGAALADESREGDGGEVADGGLVGGGVLDDFLELVFFSKKK